MRVNHRTSAREKEQRIKQYQGFTVEEQLDLIWEILEDLINQSGRKSPHTWEKISNIREQLKKK